MTTTSATLFQRLRFVLVETSHPGNIGAAARAMKTMGFARLYLVNPLHFPDPEATARASGADDILAAAVVCESLDEALRGCGLVYATTARQRSLDWPQASARQAAGEMLIADDGGDIALVFGPERTGLSNADLARCQRAVWIPTNPDYASLNLGAAVQILAYELRQTIASDAVPAVATEALAAHDGMERFYADLEQTLIDIDYLDPANPRRLMPRLRRFFNRARPQVSELQIFLGILRAIRQQRSRS